MLFDVLACGAAVDCVDTRHRLYHFINILYQEASFPVYNKLWRGSSRKRNDWTTQGHCFDHHHAERLFPLNGIEESTRAAEKIDLLLQIRRANIANLRIIELRFDLLLEVTHRFRHIAVYRSRQNKSYSCLLCRLDSQVRAFIRNAPS